MARSSNGEKIEETVLGDGDVLVIGETEIAFSCSHGDHVRSAVTQPLSQRDEARSEGLRRLMFVRQTRRLQQALLHRGGPVQWESLVAIENRAEVGYELVGFSDQRNWRPAISTELFEIECRLTRRLRAVRRLLTLELSEHLPPDRFLVLPFTAAELEAGDLPATAPCGRATIVQIAAEEISRLSNSQELAARLRSNGAGLGISLLPSDIDVALEFAAPLHPDLVKLPMGALRGFGRDERARRRGLAVIRRWEELGAKMAVAGLRDDRDAELCRQLGCQYGQGELFSHVGGTLTFWPQTSLG